MTSLAVLEKYDLLPKASPTSTETDLFCRMMRYWETEHAGVGIETVALNEDLEIGKRAHKGLEIIHKAPTVTRETILAAIEELRKEALTEPWQTWIESMLWAWGLRVWPLLKARGYKVLAVEKKLRFTRYGVEWRCIPDIVLQDAEYVIWVVDFKSCKRWDPKKYRKRMQFHIGAEAVQMAYPNLTVGGTIVVGLPKPFFRGEKAYHPLVFGYVRPEEPGLTKVAYSYEYKRGFERLDVACGFPGGVEAWVKGAPDLIINESLPMTEPIPLNTKMLDTFLRERGFREHEILDASRGIFNAGHTDWVIMQEDLPQHFPHNPSQCESEYHKCAFLDACWQPVVYKDPVASGLYRLKVVR